MKISSAIQQLTPNATGNIVLELEKLQGSIFDLELTTDGQNVAIVTTDAMYKSTDGINGRVIDPTGNSGERSFRVTSTPGHQRTDVFYITILNPTANARIYAAYSYTIE